MHITMSINCHPTTLPVMTSSMGLPSSSHLPRTSSSSSRLCHHKEEYTLGSCSTSSSCSRHCVIFQKGQEGITQVHKGGKCAMLGREGKGTEIPFQEAQAPPKKERIGGGGTTQLPSSTAILRGACRGTGFFCSLTRGKSTS